MTSVRGTEAQFVDARNVPVWHMGVVMALMLVQIACATLSSTASTDTNRDIYFAQQIASAREFPLLGPQINGMLHLGPLWFYVLAVAAWLVPNAAAVTAFIGAIGSLQFPLAYRLGYRFQGPRQGLLFVLTLALPGFMAVSLVSLTHTIAVIPCLLLEIFAAIAYRQHPNGKRALWVGLVAALALNAHPTTLILVIALLFWCAVKTEGWRARVGHSSIVVLLVVLSFAPMLYGEWQYGFADAATTATYVHEVLNVPSPSKAMFLNYAILYYGPKYMARFWLDIPPSSARGLLSIYVVMLAAAGAGLVWCLRQRTSTRNLLVALLGLLFLQSIFVCVIRSDMPAWMIYAQWPLIAGLLAVGLERICKAGAWYRVAVATGLATTTCWSIAIWIHMASGSLDLVETNGGPGKLPMMGDIREYHKDRSLFRIPRIPFRQVFAISERLCRPATLFGHYAYLVDISYGIGALYGCGDRTNVQLGGASNPGRELLVGLRDKAWARLQMKPALWIGVLGVSAPAAIWQSSTPLYPETPRLSTWPHQIVATPSRFVIEGDATEKEAVLVSHRANRYLRFSVVGAQANGVRIEPVYTDVMTAAYRLPRGFGAHKVHWRIDVEGVPEYVDALTFLSSE